MTIKTYHKGNISNPPSGFEVDRCTKISSEQFTEEDVIKLISGLNVLKHVIAVHPVHHKLFSSWPTTNNGIFIQNMPIIYTTFVNKNTISLYGKIDV